MDSNNQFKATVVRTFEFGSLNECLDLVEMLTSMTNEKRTRYIEDNKISEATLQVLIEIIKTETERLERIKSQLEIEKDAVLRAKLERELQRMRLAKELLQRDDREVMCSVGSGWPSPKGMQEFDSPSLCQKEDMNGTSDFVRPEAV